MVFHWSPSEINIPRSQVTINTRPKLSKSKPLRFSCITKPMWSTIKSDTEISCDFLDISLDMVTIDELWCDFSTRIKGTMEKNIPSQTITPHKKTPVVQS